MPIQLGPLRFEPRPFTTLLALALIAVFASLGRWQLHRADEKRALYDAFALGQDSTRTIDAATPRVPRYQRVAAAGAYDPTRQILIDNMTDANGRAGYFVVTPFALAGGGWVLVNRGWVPAGRERALRPPIAVGSETRELHGLADNLPVPGIRMGKRAVLAPPFPVLAEYPTHPELAALLHEAKWTGAAELVLLDAGDPDGYLRQWRAPGFPPMRHVAYAVQWFGLALALLVIYIATNVRRTPREGGPP